VKVIVQFGKHKGKDTEEVPSSYLRWYLEKVSERDNPELFKAVEDEMKYRNKHNAHFD
jgi:uncharacterized protein (DUF3820 family)